MTYCQIVLAVWSELLLFLTLQKVPAAGKEDSAAGHRFLSVRGPSGAAEATACNMEFVHKTEVVVHIVRYTG